MASVWRLSGEALDRWQRIVIGSGVEARHSVLPVEDVASLSTDSRMNAFAFHAPDLAVQAADEAIRQAEVRAEDITDVVVVTCTGFASPGVDVALVDRLGLPTTTRRTTIGFMGCFGAITGLRTALGACAAVPGAVVLLVCVELCSLHFRAEASVENQVAAALFADGCAAAVLTSPRPDEPVGLAQVGMGTSLLLPKGRDAMTWRITNDGFVMTLDSRVPAALKKAVARTFNDMTESGRSAPMIVHPGGPRILDAVEEGLGAPRGHLRHSRRVLSSHGNMSSPTVLFVLNDLLRSDSYAGESTMLAFGPGLSIESMPVEVRGASQEVPIQDSQMASA